MNSSRGKSQGHVDLWYIVRYTHRCSSSYFKETKTMRFHGYGRHCGEHGEHRHHGGLRGRRGFIGRFGGFMNGPGMRAARMIASGDLQLIILALLSEKSRHGYEIIKAIEEHSSGIYTPSPGVVYPALTYLEETGFALSETEGTKKLYRIAGPGIEHLAAHGAEADEMLEQLSRFGKKMAQFQRQFVEEE